MKREKLWVQRFYPKDILYEFLREGSFTTLLSQILINKGFKDIKSAYTFLYPQLSDFSDPFTLPEINLAVKRLTLALEKGETIGIYGDSDADGIIGSYLLYDFLYEISGREPIVLIPDKNKEGYGFHSKFLPYFKEKGVKLLITVDVGISALEAVKEAKALGIDVIITDHHTILEKPNTIVVSGKLAPSNSPFYFLCGAGIVFTLIRALRTYLYQQGYFSQKPIPQIRKYLELTAIATLADMVPLWGENRLLSYFGFRDLNSPSHPALKKLYQALNLKPPLSEEDLYFKIIPRINTCGRMGKPELFFEFLKEGKKGRGENYLRAIENLNKERQELEIYHWENLEREIEDWNEEPFYIGVFENLPKALLGLLANKVKNKTGKPALILTVENEIGYGSGRSPEEIDLLDLCLKRSDLFLELGGHQKAFGFQIKKEKINELIEHLKKSLVSDPFKGIIFNYVDSETTISELLLEENLLAFQSLHPYGMGNEAPFLLLKNFEVKEIFILKEKHTKYLLKEGSKEITAIFFNYLSPKAIRFIIGAPFINNYSQNLEIKIEDVKT